MFKPRQLTFEELSACLRAYEDQYGYSTIEFYLHYHRGELGDDVFWAGVYHLYLMSLPVRQLMQHASYHS